MKRSIASDLSGVKERPLCFGRPGGRYQIPDPLFPNVWQPAHARPEQCASCPLFKCCYQIREVRSREGR
jgi:hypothetical protein